MMTPSTLTFSPTCSRYTPGLTRVAPWLVGLTFWTLLASCTEEKKPSTPPPPPQVEVVEIVQKDVPIFREWVATTIGSQTAEIRGQVSGYLTKQNYKDGAFVKKGEALFEIDPRPLEAELMQAVGKFEQARGQLALAKSQVDQQQAQLAKSKAEAERTTIEVGRLTPLAKDGAVSQQELDNSVQNNAANHALVEAGKATIRAAESNVDACKANVEAAQAFTDQATLNLGFTKITAPIEGIAGISEAQIGDLVGPQTGIVLTTISTIDPIKVQFQLSEQAYMRVAVKAAQLSLELAPENLELILTDGSVYPHKGRVSVANRQVDVRTGTLTIQGVFPNPHGLLRPGQFARIRAEVEVKKAAMLVPQRCVSELQGTYQLAVVGRDDKVSIHSVKVGERVGPMWIIEDGLKMGDRVVSEGMQKARPGTMVHPKLAGAEPAAKPEPAKAPPTDGDAPKNANKPADAPSQPAKHEDK